VSSFAEAELASVRRELLDVRAPSPTPSGLSALDACRAALARPVDSPLLSELAASARRIVVIVSDESRDEPRQALLSAIREQVPWDRVTLVVASGTHAASDRAVPDAHRDRPILVHGPETPVTDLGRTPRGTRVRLASTVVDADLVVATGRIRPHYFAGYSGGAKAVFPGVALAEDALENHRLKADETARLGRVSDNACRLDMEAAVRLLPAPVFLLNVLADVEGNVAAASAGHVVAAHRSLLPRAKALFSVPAPRARVVVVADRPPVSSSLYQASKLLPPAGALLEDGGVVILVADLELGIGPMERVNRGIYELGVRPQLPARHRVLLVSRLGASAAHGLYAEPRESLDAALREALAVTASARAVGLWRAGELVAVPE
jgi:nickel-dependent lactate racemase